VAQLIVLGVSCPHLPFLMILAMMMPEVIVLSSVQLIFTTTHTSRNYAHCPHLCTTTPLSVVVSSLNELRIGLRNGGFNC
jgi:hypothetical protein